MPTMSNIVDSQYFGACDYFKTSEEGREMYVGTQFVHCGIFPCEAKKSFLVTSDTSEAIPLPAVVGRSVRWAWLRTLAWICAVVAIKGVVIGIIIEVRSGGRVNIMAWWLPLVALSAVFLGLAIFLKFYKPKATEESKQKYQRYLLGLLADSRRRRGQAPQDRHEQMAAAAAVHGGPADEVITIEPHPPYLGPRKDDANIPLIACSPTSNPSAGN
ncbi:uncharacterized protein LOC118431559 [Branchiostoma floridae]|uniref:Uncharacterized protein LOC118431559 n=1 Tax=Branchiostoma floridae TaxID=7739 RepID=A0A9J7MD39_BRAFL|nr:uncharacterized protein LOC118431559 [Branchiostoma floridae]